MKDVLIRFRDKPKVYMRRKGHVKAAALLRSFPQLLAALSIGYGLYVEADSYSTLLFVLNNVLFILATSWWGMCWFDCYEEEKKVVNKSLSK